MDVPGVGRRRDGGVRLRSARVAHVDHAEALGEHVADIGEAALHHDLHAVGPAALVGVAEEPHVAGKVGGGEVDHSRTLTTTAALAAPAALSPALAGERASGSPSPPSPASGG